VIMDNRLEVRKTDEDIIRWCEQEGIKVCVMTTKNETPDWHNDETPIERYEPIRWNSLAVWMGVVVFCGGGWLGFLFAMWLES